MIIAGSEPIRANANVCGQNALANASNRGEVLPIRRLTLAIGWKRFGDSEAARTVALAPVYAERTMAETGIIVYAFAK